MIDATFVSTINGRGYAALKAVRRNSGNTAYEFATGVWTDQSYGDPAWITSLAASKVGLGNVTNDVQTKAAIVPNTLPLAGQVLVGNAGGTAYAPETVSGDATLASTGAITLKATGTAGTYGDSTHTLTITTDAQGRVTAVSTNALGTAALKNTGTSGNTVPLLDGVNTWSGTQTVSVNQDALTGLVLTNNAGVSADSGPGVSAQTGAYTSAWLLEGATGHTHFNIPNAKALLVRTGGVNYHNFYANGGTYSCVLGIDLPAHGISLSNTGLCGIGVDSNTISSQFQVLSGSASRVAATVQGAASGTAPLAVLKQGASGTGNFLTFLGSTGTTVGYVSSDAKLLISGGTSGSPGLAFGNCGFYSDGIANAGFAEGGAICVTFGAANGGIPYFTIGGIAPALRTSSGVLYLGDTLVGGSTWGGIACGQPATTTIGLEVDGIASSTVPTVVVKRGASPVGTNGIKYQEWQSSDGVSRAFVGESIGNTLIAGFTAHSSPTSNYDKYLTIGLFQDNSGGDVGAILCEQSNGTPHSLLLLTPNVIIGEYNGYGGQHAIGGGGLVIWANTTASGNELPANQYAALITTAPRSVGDARPNLEIQMGPGAPPSGSTDTAGKPLTLWGGIGTGTGAGGSIIFQTSPAGSTGTTNNTLATRLSLDSAGVLKRFTAAGDPIGNVGGTVHVDYTDAGNTHTDGTFDDLYSYTLPANFFQNNGDSLRAKLLIQITTSNGETDVAKVVFAGTTIATQTVNGLGPGTTLAFADCLLIRESSTVVRCSVDLNNNVTYTRITGLTLTGTNIFKCTGAASGGTAAANHVVALVQYVNRGEAA